MTIGLFAYLYPWTKAFHVIAMVAWMAATFYMPRLFVYHCDVRPGSAESERFKVMEYRLFRQIMNPAMIATWILGLLLLDFRTANFRDPGLMLQPWMATKLAGVVFQTGWHHFLGRARKDIARGVSKRSGKFWRAVNELPFLAAIVMVLAVTTEFGSR